EDLLDVSRLAMGRVSFTLEEFDLANLAATVAETWRETGRLAQHALSVSLKPACVLASIFFVVLVNDRYSSHSGRGPHRHQGGGAAAIVSFVIPDSRPAAARCGESLQIGSRTISRAPCPAPSLSARSAPPCISTSRRTRASPRPMPPCGRLASCSPCTNG